MNCLFFLGSPKVVMQQDLAVMAQAMGCDHREMTVLLKSPEFLMLAGLEQITPLKSQDLRLLVVKEQAVLAN